MSKEVSNELVNCWSSGDLYFPQSTNNLAHIRLSGDRESPQFRRRYLRSKKKKKKLPRPHVAWKSTRQNLFCFLVNPSPFTKLTVPRSGDYLKSVQMSEDSDRSRTPSTVGTEALVLSFAPLLKSQGVSWAWPELHVFATTEQGVRVSEGLQSVPEEQWRQN